MKDFIDIYEFYLSNNPNRLSVIEFSDFIIDSGCISCDNDSVLLSICGKIVKIAEIREEKSLFLINIDDEIKKKMETFFEKMFWTFPVYVYGFYNIKDKRINLLDSLNHSSDNFFISDIVGEQSDALCQIRELNVIDKIECVGKKDILNNYKIYLDVGEESIETGLSLSFLGEKRKNNTVMTKTVIASIFVGIALNIGTAVGAEIDKDLSIVDINTALENISKDIENKPMDTEQETLFKNLTETLQKNIIKYKGTMSSEEESIAKAALKTVSDVEKNRMQKHISNINKTIDDKASKAVEMIVNSTGNSNTSSVSQGGLIEEEKKRAIITQLKTNIEKGSAELNVSSDYIKGLSAKAKADATKNEKVNVGVEKQIDFKDLAVSVKMSSVYQMSSKTIENEFKVNYENYSLSLKSVSKNNGKFEEKVISVGYSLDF